MLYSMTGFGRAVAEADGMKIIVEVKSLNSKQMDLTTRVPQSLRSAEPEIRNAASLLLERGKVDLNVLTETITGSAAVKLNVPVMKAYKAEIEAMAAALNLPEPEDWYSLLMRFPDVMRTDSTDDAAPEAISALMRATDSALAELMEHRRAEGRRLEDFFAIRIKKIGELLAQVPNYEEERIARIRTRITEGVEKVAQADYDKGRLEQEMIYYIEKLDINEEKQRLAQHLAYFMETMQSPQAGQGKKLGFISQEMGREINTLGSKSNHAELQKLVVMMKDELEQIKEQVLNVM